MSNPSTFESHNQLRITVIGGGHGTAAIYPEIARSADATAIISMSDSGGSSDRLMKEFEGLPPVGDLTNVITAASQSSAIRSLNGTRLPGNGPLGGHTPRNVMLTGFVLNHGLPKGVRMFSEAMQVLGKVIPVTLERHELVMGDGDTVIHGEHGIDTHQRQSAEPWIWHEPPVPIDSEARQAIADSDLIVYAPGSPFTSQLAALCVQGVREALQESKVPKVLIANLANEHHDTEGWHVADYVSLLLRHGIPVDAVIYNQATDAVEAAGKQPVGIEPERFSEIPTVRAIGAVVTEAAAPSHGRAVHDPLAVAKQLLGRTIDSEVS